ncbi:MAG: zf-HC2 domain-containing protein [Blastocatellia bacterium]
MTEHLSSAQIENYRQCELAPNELLSVDDHLAACVECRRQIKTALNYGAAEVALYAQLPAETDAPSHLNFEQSAGYVDGLLTGDERQTVKDHLASCAQCAMAVDDLRAFRNEIAPELDREYLPKEVAAGAAARAAAPASWRDRIVAALPAPFFKVPLWVYAPALLLLAVTGWMAWRATPKQRPPQIAITSPTPAPSPSINFASPTPPTPEVAPVLAQLNDGGGRVILDGQGKLSGVDHLPPAYQRLVKQALTAQRVEKSPLLAGLSRPGSSLMGGDEEGNRFAVSEPVGTVVVTDRPTFRWSKLQGATGYVVEVYDAQFNPVATSPSLNRTIWTSPPLTRGQVYSWQVKTLKNGEEFTAPPPSAPQAKFRVLDQATANQLAEARRAYPSSHLVLGLLYAQAGLLNEAEREFRALQQANPDSALARKLPSSLSALRN